MWNYSDIHANFPIKQRMTYLNNASIAPMSTPVIEAVDTFLADVRDNGRNRYPEWCHRADTEIKDRIAQLLGAQRSEVAFVKNTTEGILIVANGIDWRPGDNVVIADIEYPSNVYCWMNLERQGVSVRWIKTHQGRFTADTIRPLLDDRTRLLSLSAVQFLNGFKADLAAIGELCKSRQILFNLDAIQMVGALKLDVSRYAIDFLSAGGHKWLMSPIGTGIFYCHRHALEKLHPANVGYHSVVDKAEDDINYDLTWRPDAGRFEEGLVNFPGIWGLNKAVEMISRLGLDQIEAHILHLTDLAIDGLKNQNYRILSPLARTERSGILSFQHPNKPAALVCDRLREADIHVAVRGDALRISPSFYNDSQEIAAMLEALP